MGKCSTLAPCAGGDPWRTRIRRRLLHTAAYQNPDSLCRRGSAAFRKNLSLLVDGWRRTGNADVRPDPGFQRFLLEKELIVDDLNRFGRIAAEVGGIGRRARTVHQHTTSGIGQRVVEIEPDRLTAVVIETDLTEIRSQPRLVTSSQGDVGKLKRQRATGRLFGQGRRQLGGHFAGKFRGGFSLTPVLNNKVSKIP